MADARNDLTSAQVLGSNPIPLLDTGIYHCQQAARVAKAIKGFLVFADQHFPRTHDIETLINLAIPYEARFVGWVDAGRELTPYATLYRYLGPFANPNRHQFDQAFISAEQLYHFVLSLLPAQTHPSYP